MTALVSGIATAANGSANMIFTPEMSGMLDSNRQRALSQICAETQDPVLAAICAAAKDHKIWVHLGSLALRSDQADDHSINRGFVIDDCGRIRARYDKLHLFDVDLPTGESWRESAAYKAGNATIVVDTPIGLMGMAICYDLRFPALFAAQSEAGAKILTVPSSFTVPTGTAHWHVLLRARAIENACWVIAAAQSGTHEDGRSTYGHSLIINPWGEVVLDMKAGEGVAFATLDLAEVDAVRGRIPVLKHRRPIPKVTVYQ
ncbi:MAG: carbon-nitrogen hydrolase family protein [Chakrabartia sp.]